MANSNPVPSITPAVFRQLHVKLPTETFREILPQKWLDDHPNQDKTKSDEWLDAHPKGFLLMHGLRDNYPDGRNLLALLLESIDTNVLIVNKRFPRLLPKFRDDQLKEYDMRVAYQTPNPNELRFSTLDDHRVDAKLPSAPYFPTLYAYGFPRGKSPGPDRSDMFSLYFRYYNGGTLTNLSEMYRDPLIGSPIPEPFIWHVMDQLGRAVLSLRKGCSNNFIENNLGVDQLLKLSCAPDGNNTHPFDQWDKDWKPVVHLDITERNVLLHFPEDGEPLSRCFPQIVLEGFKHASFLDDLKGAAKELEWEDLYMLGELLCRLVTNHDAPDEDPSHTPDESAAVIARMLPKYLPENLNLADGQKPAYSKELITLLQRWARLRPSANPLNQDQDGTVNAPNPEHFFFEVLSLARKKAEVYRRMGYDELAKEDGDGYMADVSWVKPDPSFAHIPYAVGDGREEKMLQTLARELKWLFGPYIPVWYRYDGIDVSAIPPEAEEFYTITERDGDQGQAAGDGQGTDDDGPPPPANEDGAPPPPPNPHVAAVLAVQDAVQTAIAAGADPGAHNAIHDAVSRAVRLAMDALAAFQPPSAQQQVPQPGGAQQGPAPAQAVPVQPAPAQPAVPQAPVAQAPQVQAPQAQPFPDQVQIQRAGSAPTRLQSDQNIPAFLAFARQPAIPPPPPPPVQQPLPPPPPPPPVQQPLPPLPPPPPAPNPVAAAARGRPRKVFREGERRSARIAARAATPQPAPPAPAAPVPAPAVPPPAAPAPAPVPVPGPTGRGGRGRGGNRGEGRGRVKKIGFRRG